ncbi:nitrate- and nitrite sensing domain-containing protein [Streptomyces gamaensis]|uniref:histidine kinase n=1 Tax=Streptomyces gamaensis TaxID=1763542 RepID=A0ABW0Z2W6_9ACTN
MPERTVRVRKRLTASVAAMALTVLGASAFGVLDALRGLDDADRAAGSARAAVAAVALAHALEDERDAMTPFVAGGRAEDRAPAASAAQRARVDRQITEFRRAAAPSASGSSAGSAGSASRFGDALKALDALPATRRQALGAGGADAIAVLTAYTGTLQTLRNAAGALAPAPSVPIVPPVPGAGAGPGIGAAAALPPLGRAVEEASATRALLLAALAAHGTQPPLTAAAQRAVAGEQAALADFGRLAPAGPRDTYARTVRGGDVTTAEGQIARLTGPQAGTADLEQPAQPVHTALTARLDRMRTVETGLTDTAAGSLDRQRGAALTALAIRAGAAALCLLLAVLLGVRSARSMTRPLGALRLGARRVCADPAGAQPVPLGDRGFRGCDDEFAETARCVNILRQAAVRDRERIAVLEAERNRLAASGQEIAEERDALRERHEALLRETEERLSSHPSRLSATGHPQETPEEPAHGLCVGLSRRTLGLVDRQLALIEGLEAHEADPERLENLFRLDHFATRMRRNSENLLVLAGAGHGPGHPGPVALLDVLRASAGEIEQYPRVRIQSLPQHARIQGHASEDVSHLIAELLENATAFSPADAQVQVSGWLLEGGEIMLSVQDEGIGVAPDRLAELNSLLADAGTDGRPLPLFLPAQATGEDGARGRPGAFGSGPAAGTGTGAGRPAAGLGLHVVARLAARHGIHVELREQPAGGITAVVILPDTLHVAGPPVVTGLGDTPPVPGAAVRPLHLPGSLAESDSYAPRGRSRRGSGTHAGAPGGAGASSPGFGGGWASGAPDGLTGGGTGPTGPPGSLGHPDAPGNGTGEPGAIGPAGGSGNGAAGTPGSSGYSGASGGGGGSAGSGGSGNGRAGASGSPGYPGASGGTGGSAGAGGLLGASGGAGGTGPTGTPGSSEYSGASGLAGNSAGTPGLPGAPDGSGDGPGTLGSPGYPGAPGSNGPTGRFPGAPTRTGSSAGTRGTPGDPGNIPAGAPGSSGYPGASGGAGGSAGAGGVLGASGGPGGNGPTGPPGSPGYPGTTGGAGGSAGAGGLPGASGGNGPTATPGSPGYPGAPGAIGTPGRTGKPQPPRFRPVGLPGVAGTSPTEWSVDTTMRLGIFPGTGTGTGTGQSPSAPPFQPIDPVRPGRVRPPWAGEPSGASPKGRHARPQTSASPGAQPPGWERVDLTGQGLPRRIPQPVPPRPEPARPRQGVDAQALRDKLAGFQQGARDGRRAAEAEWAAGTTDRNPSRNQAGSPADGGTVEEARG